MKNGLKVVIKYIKIYLVKILRKVKHLLFVKPKSFISKVIRKLKRDYNKSYTLDMVVEEYFKNRNGLEVGGPSDFFEKRGFLPIYQQVKVLDGVNYSSSTIWTGEIDMEKGYIVEGCKVGKQYISDAVDMSPLKGKKYDFVLSCFMIEHIANPLKAIEKWLSVLKPGGVLLIVAPNKELNFDHKRETNTFAHLLADYRSNTGEDDLTHLDEIMELHDLGQDPLAGSREQFYERSLKNHENRCLHHHIFDMKLLEEIYDFFNLTILQQVHVGYGFLIIGRKEKMSKYLYNKICKLCSGKTSSSPGK